MSSNSKIWLITGVSRGFGLALAKAAVHVGDVVIGLVRNVAQGAALIVEAVKSVHPPLRLPLRQMAIERMRLKMVQVGKDIDAWESRSLATVFDT